MGGWDDDTAVQRKAQLRLLSSLPALRLQDSAERADASGIPYHPVPEVRRSIRRDVRPETHQHLLSTALPAAADWGSHARYVCETLDGNDPNRSASIRFGNRYGSIRIRACGIRSWQPASRRYYSPGSVDDDRFGAGCPESKTELLAVRGRASSKRSVFREG